MLTIVLAAAVLQFPAWAEARDKLEPGGGEYVDTKHPKVEKDYYVVHKDQSDKCSIVADDWAKKPEGAIGGAPYASKDYAKAALKKFPECKGGETDEASDEKHKKK
jgi:hypothetical protein